MPVFITIRSLLAVFLVALISSPAFTMDEELVTDSRLAEIKAFTRGDDRQRENPPTIDKPEFISVTDAALSLDLNEIVFIEEPHGKYPARIYPRRIMVHHEVVNVKEGKSRRSITYCPLTGSIIGFIGKVGPHKTTFGTMGMISNSNRVFYDRATNSLWPQLLGASMQGPLKGHHLQLFPLLWTTWKRAKAAYPDARVLSRRTGFKFIRYGKDPYGSYQREKTYYNSGGAYFPIAHADNTIQAKEPIIGVLWKEDAAAAVIRNAVRQEKVVYMDRGLDPVVAMYDKELDAVRVFLAYADGRTLSFINVNDEIVDRETRSRWSIHGKAYEGRLRGMQLERVAAFETMWFGWKAFHPYSEVWGRKYARDVEE